MAGAMIRVTSRDGFELDAWHVKPAGAAQGRRHRHPGNLRPVGSHQGNGGAVRRCGLRGDCAVDVRSRRAGLHRPAAGCRRGHGARHRAGDGQRTGECAQRHGRGVRPAEGRGQGLHHRLLLWRHDELAGGRADRRAGGGVLLLRRQHRADGGPASRNARRSAISARRTRTSRWSARSTRSRRRIRMSRFTSTTPAMASRGRIRRTMTRRRTSWRSSGRSICSDKPDEADLHLGARGVGQADRRRERWRRRPASRCFTIISWSMRCWRNCQFGDPEFVRLREAMWMTVFDTAAKSGQSLIFTFAPEPTVEAGFADARSDGDRGCGRGGEVRPAVRVAPTNRSDASARTAARSSAS